MKTNTWFEYDSIYYIIKHAVVMVLAVINSHRFLCSASLRCTWGHGWLSTA